MSDRQDFTTLAGRLESIILEAAIGDAQFRPPFPKTNSCVGHLGRAAAHIEGNGRRVVIVTGFYVPDADPPAAETDGPPGACVLASVLHEVGIEAVILTDTWCADAVQAAARQCPAPVPVQIAERVDDVWIADYLAAEQTRGLTHLIAIERAGPCHTTESLREQCRRFGRTVDESKLILERFSEAVPSDSHGRCHNMRGVVIDETTAPLHLLFQHLPRWCPQAKSIGIGDGGNEIGMGSVPFDELAWTDDGNFRSCIPCGVATDWNIIARVSNWGAWALAALVAFHRGRRESLDDWTPNRHFRLTEAMVEQGSAIDGVTLQPEVTVDGLPFLKYVQAWQDIVATLKDGVPHNL